MLLRSLSELSAQWLYIVFAHWSQQNEPEPHEVALYRAVEIIKDNLSEMDSLMMQQTAQARASIKQ